MARKERASQNGRFHRFRKRREKGRLQLRRKKAQGEKAWGAVANKALKVKSPHENAAA